MVALGLVSLVAALLCMAAERHLGTRAPLFGGAALSLVTGVALPVTGASHGVLGVIAARVGVCAASVGGAILTGRGLRRPGGVR